MNLAVALLSIALRALELDQPRLVESVSVVEQLPSLETPLAVTRLDRADLLGSPSLALDDSLRSIPGFSLFRRSSSRVANPTTQGVTLRGLAASGASRALVLADDVPLNDPFGGWVYWNRIPAAALSEVLVARGAAGDLHGADALAGVVSVRSARDRAVRVIAEWGTHDTARASAYGGTGTLFGAAEAFTTAGFVTVEPEVRGLVDTPAGSEYVSGTAGVSLDGAAGNWLLRSAHVRESRENGTPLQRNATRMTQVSGRWLRATGGRGGWSAHAYAQTQHYEQTFSAVLAERASERLTNAQDVGANALGATAKWSMSGSSGGAALTVAARHVTADLVERPSSGPARQVAASQSTAAIAAQGSWSRSATSVGGGIRAEAWLSGDEASGGKVFANPRLWIAHRRPGSALAWTAAFQSGFRVPTLNELYRSFRVGSVVTDANPALRPERAHGIETGVSRAGLWSTLRVVAFWTRVEDAIVNVTLSSRGSTIQRQRQNAATVRAAGVEFEADVRPLRWLELSAATTWTHARFVSGPPDGLDIPQVPALQHALGVRAVPGRAALALEWRFIGRQYDDDRNQFALDPSSTFDARAGWFIRRRIEIFAAMENVLDTEQDVGRTPLRTLGLPRTVRIGVRVEI